VNEISLKYEYVKGKEQHEGLTLQGQGKFIKSQDDIVISSKDKFQRISFYENGIVTSEEIYNGRHVLRFNFPYTETQLGTLVFDK
jgi:hypothetical protein